MPVLLQICIVTLTIGLLAIAVMTVRTMIRLNAAAVELSKLTHAVRESVVTVDLAIHEARALVASLQECAPPVLRVLRRVDAVSERAADFSSTILEELELPVFAAAAVARGVRSGATHLLKRLFHRISNRHSPINGGYDHE